MTALKASVVKSTFEKVQVVYLDRETSKWWNARRRPDDTTVFCGWYWINGEEEAGPFKSRSAAVRDAYYRFVLHREIPNVGHSALYGVPRERKQRRKGTISVSQTRIF